MTIKILFLTPVFFTATAFAGFHPAAETARPESFTGVCQKITDGDSIVVITQQGDTVAVQLRHIDCPEHKPLLQPFAEEASQFTRAFCLGQTLLFEVGEPMYDSYDRLLAEIKKDGENLNLALVEAGLAWHYKRFSDDPRYDQAETAAREAKRGLWSGPDPIEPWNWRKRAVKKED